MPNTKKIISSWNETGKTIYAIVRREADSYRLNDADGTFASNPADPYLSLTEDAVIKGLYQASEARTTWLNGRYTVLIYKQSGGSPSPLVDMVIGIGDMWIENDLEVVVDATLSKESQRLFNLVEYQRGSHTGRGNMFFWNPVGGNDASDGLTPSTARLTWSGVYALAAAYSHDIIIAMPGDAGNPTTIDTTIIMDKAFTFLRGPGRDFRFKPTSSGNDTVTISAPGCELFGVIVETHTAGNRDAIKVTSDCAKINSVWVDQIRGHGIAIENGSNCLLDKVVVQDAAAGGSGHAISIKSTGGNAKRKFMKNIKLLTNAGNGIIFQGANTQHNYTVAGEIGSAIAHNTGYGITEIDGADYNDLIGPGIMIESNVPGDINLTGVNSSALNCCQYAMPGDSMDMLSISGDSIAADNLEKMFDGTGYFDSLAPSYQGQISTLAGGVSQKIPVTSIQ